MKYSIFIYITLVLNFTGFSQNNQMYYDHVYPFRSGFSLVVLDGKFGVINSKFEEVIPPILNDVNNFDLSDYFFDGFLYGVINDSTILFNTKGEKVKAFNNPKVYPSRNFVNEKIDSLYIQGYSGSLGCEKENRTVIIPYKFNQINKGLKNQIIATKNAEDMFLPIGDVNKNHSKETIIYSFKGDTIYHLNGIVKLWKSANIYFVEDKKVFRATDYLLKPINDEVYINVSPTNSNLCWVQTEQGWGVINSSFEYIIKPQFNSIYSNKYWTMVEKNNKYGFVNSLGVQITNLEYDSERTQYVSDAPIIVAYKKDRLTFLDTSGACMYNCEQKDTIYRVYPNGKPQVKGLFKNNVKVGTWYYYSDDNQNSLSKTINYTDSINTYTVYNKQGEILETWNEKK